MRGKTDAKIKKAFGKSRKELKPSSVRLQQYRSPRTTRVYKSLKVSISFNVSKLAAINPPTDQIAEQNACIEELQQQLEGQAQASEQKIPPPHGPVNIQIAMGLSESAEDTSSYNSISVSCKIQCSSDTHCLRRSALSAAISSEPGLMSQLSGRTSRQFRRSNCMPWSVLVSLLCINSPYL